MSDQNTKRYVGLPTRLQFNAIGVHLIELAIDGHANGVWQEAIDKTIVFLVQVKRLAARWQKDGPIKNGSEIGKVDRRIGPSRNVEVFVSEIVKVQRRPLAGSNGCIERLERVITFRSRISLFGENRLLDES